MMAELDASVLEHMSDGYVSLDSEWRYTYVNGHGSRIIGRPPAELIGRRIWEVSPELVGTSFQLACERALAEQEPVAVEGMFYATERWLECRIYPADDGLTVFFTDASERRANDTRLRESEERFRQLTENVREVFWLIGLPAGEVLYASRSFETLRGHSPASFLEDPQEVLQAVHLDDRDRLVESFQRVRRGDEASAEYRLVRSGEAERWMSTRLFPIRNEEGEVHRIAGTTEDVSDRKVLEAQLLQAQKMEAVGRLAGGVAHDFNNQLTAILGFATLMEGEVTPESELAEYVSEILKAGQRSAKLTNKLLAFSRRQVLQARVFDLGTVVASVDVMLRRLIEKKIELVTLPGVVKAKVRADPVQMEQVLVNLVVNSRDAMPDGGRILIHVLQRHVDRPLARSHGTIPAGDYVVLAVSDDGIGMDEATLARVFEPFFTTKPSDKGTGLGLPMVLGIVQQSGGYISVFSKPDGGTTVKVYLPAVHEPVPESGDSAEVRQPEGIGTVLLVEDEPSVRALTRVMLERGGYAVLEAENGEVGARVWAEQKHSIDVVVTDLTMPLMGGKELGRRIGADPNAVPVIYISGYSDDLGFGGDGTSTDNFLPKPFSPEELVQKVGRALRRGS